MSKPMPVLFKAVLNQFEPLRKVTVISLGCKSFWSETIKLNRNCFRTILNFHTVQLWNVQWKKARRFRFLMTLWPSSKVKASEDGKWRQRSMMPVSMENQRWKISLDCSSCCENKSHIAYWANNDFVNYQNSIQIPAVVSSLQIQSLRLAVAIVHSVLCPKLLYC